MSLQQTAKLQELTQNRLSTGLRVNSAIDNPSSYYTAAALNNRASDLSALLDAMSQGIQTLKAAQQGLQTASTFLEQAASVANQALETAPEIVDKSWFEQQDGVAAVVSTAAELTSVIDSGKTGNIVIYGLIEMENTPIILKTGQNLVGVGYYSDINSNARDAVLDKFSKITFDFKYDGITEDKSGIYIDDNCLLADLSIELKTDKIGSPNTTNSVVKGKTAKVFYALKNMDILFNTDNDPNITSSIQRFSGLAIGGCTIEGKVNIRCSNETSRAGVMGISEVSGGITLRGNAVLNLDLKGNNRGITDSLLNLYDQSQVTVNNVKKTVGIGWSTVKIYSSEAVLTLKNSTWGPSVAIDAPEGSKIYQDEALWTVPPGGVAKVVPTDANFIVDRSIHAELPDDFMESDSKHKFPYAQAENAEEALKLLKSSSMQFNSILEQFDGAAKDSSYRGINLLQSNTLSVNFNESRSSALEIQGIDVSAEALGLKREEWASHNGISRSLAEIASALKQIRSYTQEFGNFYSTLATRENFTEKLINILTEGADKLILADMNEEAANLLMLETRQNLAINALSFAAQAGQTILKLF